jgi:hypothetical protein
MATWGYVRHLKSRISNVYYLAGKMRWPARICTSAMTNQELSLLANGYVYAEHELTIAHFYNLECYSKQTK